MSRKEDKAVEYIVVRPFWDGPRLYSEGEKIHLTAEQARYRGDEIELKSTPAAAGPTATDKGGRRTKSDAKEAADE